MLKIDRRYFDYTTEEEIARSVSQEEMVDKINELVEEINELKRSYW